ncbi:hypothetical protein C2G38_2236225 [Gigaspora rosea]|uniref:Uncharacterized protein n=1 Tax=Gigaspora rosea TaxID=44941 RepID=A0A397TP71_9GLOM|nr:hypothetical protein C2G38_2236225 [Gigaspora rosea]CAG8637817.1 25627_t:CDS:1 [Gigaspora rosea]
MIKTNNSISTSKGNHFSSVKKDSRSLSVKKLLLANGLKVKILEFHDEYSIFEVSFQNFIRYLIIWDVEISNVKGYQHLQQITSDKKFKNEWIIVGNSLINENRKDRLELFVEQTGEEIKQMYFSEYEIIDYLKQMFFDDYYSKLKGITKHYQKVMFVNFMIGKTKAFDNFAIKSNFEEFHDCIKFYNELMPLTYWGVMN